MDGHSVQMLAWKWPFSVIVQLDQCRLVHFSAGKMDPLVHMDGHSVQMFSMECKVFRHGG